MKIEVGKWYKTLDGNKVFICFDRPYSAWPMIGVIEGKASPACWNVGGESSPYSSFLDLVEEWKEPKTGVAYVNVFADGSSNSWGCRKEADEDFNGNMACRVACVRVEWKEGQFDE